MQNYQYSFDLIEHNLGASIIQQRTKDGYINATELCKVAGKLWADYARNATSKAYFIELSADMEIPITELIQTVRGGNGQQGTWVHPQIAINLGQWLSAKFAVKVSKWVYDWMNGKNPSGKPPPLPFHIHRYVINNLKIPGGYFSILQETALNLIAPLHYLGFEIPPNWVPDISVGRLFCKWLRVNKGIDTDALSTYDHEYQDHRGVVKGVKLYPDALLADYRDWFRQVWLPCHGFAYFKSRDPKSLQYVDKLPALAGPTAANNLSANKTA